MERLWALKSDFDPLGRIFLGSSGAGFLFRITRCTVYRCPYCRWIFQITWGHRIACSVKQTAGAANGCFEIGPVTSEPFS